MSARPDASASDDREADVVVLVAQRGLTGVQRHANRELRDDGTQGHLGLERCVHRFDRMGEDRDDAVAFALFLRPRPAVRGDRRVEDLVVLRDQARHGVRRRLPRLSRSLDVGEQERHHPGGQRLVHERHAAILTEMAAPSRHRPCVVTSTASDRREVLVTGFSSDGCERAANLSSHSVGMSTTGVRTVHVKVLGAIDVELEQPPALGGPTQRRVLAVLALHAGEVVSVDRLVDAVWPDGDAPERADHNVRTYVHRLRSALGDDGNRIETAANGYRLHLERHELDASRFEDLVAEGRAAAARDDHDDARRCFDDALALWGGRPYDEFADEEWARAEVARLDELRASAVEHRNAALLDAGRHTEVIGELRDAATEQPWREVRRMQLALALYRSGRQAEALQVLRDYRTGLVDELGLDPSPELGRLEHRILEHDPELLPPSHRRHDLRGYRLDEVVGEGAFALVWRGVQPSLGRTVAVKQIRAELANHPDFVRRFETEAQTVAMLEHPHIVPLYDYWREPDGAYLVMRYVSGGSLESEVLQGGLDESRLRRFVEQAGSALEAAHRMGVIHRDVKAANVLLDDNGNFYLTDFGIAFIGSAVDDELATSLSTGSPAYASPEQLRRQVLDVRTDVYGFGITLFEAATGRLPFADAPTEAALVRRQLDEPVPAPSSVEPAVPPWVDEVVARATAKNPSDRYASMAELMAAVAPGAGRTDRHAVPARDRDRRRRTRQPVQGLAGVPGGRHRRLLRPQPSGLPVRRGPLTAGLGRPPPGGGRPVGFRQVVRGAVGPGASTSSWCSDRFGRLVHHHDAPRQPPIRRVRIGPQPRGGAPARSTGRDHAQRRARHRPGREPDPPR